MTSERLPPPPPPPSPRRRLAAAAATAAAGVVLAAATATPTAAATGAARPTPTAPWSWEYLGGDLAAAAAPGTPPAAGDGGIASWATPAGLYALLHPAERPGASELRRWEPAEGYWATVGVANTGGVGDDGGGGGGGGGRAGRRAAPVDGGGHGRVAPTAVVGGATAGDAAGVAGGRLWLWGGIRTAPPYGPSDGLYQYTPAGPAGGDGSWTRLAGTSPAAAAAAPPCDADAAAAPCAGTPGAVLVFAPASGSLYLLLPSTGDGAGGGAGLALWRYGLGGGGAGRGWSRVTPGGTPPAPLPSLATGADGSALAAVAHRDTLIVLRRPSPGGRAEFWLVSGLWTAAPAWRRVRGRAAVAAAALLLTPYGRFWDGDRFLLGYVPGSLATVPGGPPAMGDEDDDDAGGGGGGGGAGAGLPGLTVGWGGGRGAHRPLADVDRWVVLDAATLAAAAIEAPGLPHNESALAAAAAAVGTTPDAYGGYYDDGGEEGGPPTGGARVLLGGSPLRRVAPHTGGGGGGVRGERRL